MNAVTMRRWWLPLGLGLLLIGGVAVRRNWPNPTARALIGTWRLCAEPETELTFAPTGMVLSKQPRSWCYTQQRWSCSGTQLQIWDDVIIPSSLTWNTLNACFRRWIDPPRVPSMDVTFDSLGRLHLVETVGSFVFEPIYERVDSITLEGTGR